MLYEDPTKDVTTDERFHVELHFSPGVNCCVQKELVPGPGFRQVPKVQTLFCSYMIKPGDILFLTQFEFSHPVFQKRRDKRGLFSIETINPA